MNEFYDKDILTELDWFLNCEPNRFNKFICELPDENRFRFLALEWGRAMRHSFIECYNHRMWFDLFEKWVQSGAEFPIEQMETTFRPLERLLPVDSFMATCADCIRSRHFAVTAKSAAYAFAAFFPRCVDTSSIDPLQPSIQSSNDVSISWEQRSAASERHSEMSLRRFCDEFRCVAGNPFRPVTFDPAWRTTQVLDLAQTIDRKQKYDLLPILADVLEESGCSNCDILSHCRIPAKHVRGCWVVDLAMGVIDSLHEKQ